MEFPNESLMGQISPDKRFVVIKIPCQEESIERDRAAGGPAGESSVGDCVDVWLRACVTLYRGESLIWVGYHSLGQLLALKQIELESPATSQIEDNFKVFPTII